MSDLMALVGALNPDVIGITKSWGNYDIADSEFSLPGFDMSCTDRTRSPASAGIANHPFEVRSQLEQHSP